MTISRSTSVALCLALLVGPAVASAADADEPARPAQVEPEKKKKRPLLFPAFRKKDKAADERASDAGDEALPADGADAPATELPSEGIWEWVDRMDGEIPTEEQLEAIEEAQQVEVDELVRTDDLSGGDVPLAFYGDPAKHLEVDPLFLDLVDPSEFDIPIEVNAEVAKWVRYFTGPGRKYYARWMSRSTRYRPMMYEKLDKAGLPRDLVYLSMIESGYNAHAYSHVGAAGLWQFMPSTGRLYKLRVDWWVDDRRDPHKAMAREVVARAGKPPPVLLKQYFAMGARTFGLGIDPEFGGCCDVLCELDIRAIHPRILVRYMGREGAAAYLARHREPTSQPVQEAS